MQRRDDQGDDAEHRILEQRGRQRAGPAQQRLQAGVAGEGSSRELDGEIAQIQRLADGDEADDQEKLDLIGGRAERDFFHRANMVGNIRWGKTKLRSALENHVSVLL